MKWFMFRVLYQVLIILMVTGCIHLFGTYGEPTHTDGEGGVIHTVYHLKHLIGAGGATLGAVILAVLGWKFGGKTLLRRIRGLLK